MDAPDESPPSALQQERPDAFIKGAARAPPRYHLGGRKERGRLAEFGDMLRDIFPDRVDPGLRRDRRSLSVSGRHDAAQRIGERGVDASLARQMIEGEGFVEAAHLDRPFDRLAAAVERERAARLARDPHHPAVDLRRERTVDLELGFAGGLALFERGEIEKWKLDRALDLEGARADQKDRGRVGVDALDRVPAILGIGKIGRRIAEQRQDRFLRVWLAVHGTFRLAECAARAPGTGRDLALFSGRLHRAHRPASLSQASHKPIDHGGRSRKMAPRVHPFGWHQPTPGKSHAPQ